MKSTLSFVVAAIAVGIVAGAAVGYWEARPWAAGRPIALSAGGGATAKPPQAGDVVGQPRAAVPELVYKFGNMESGATQKHTFPVQNTGTAPLTVDFVSHTCKCTEVRLNGKLVEAGAGIIVPPGDQAEVMLEWAAKVAPGPFRHGATFRTNDPELDRLEIIVEGDIVESTMLEPAQLLFGSVRVGQPATAQLVVLAFLEPKVEIVSHEVLGEQLTGRLQVRFEPLTKDQLPSQKANDGVRVIATYEPGETLGRFAGSLRLTTNLKQASRLEVPVSGTVKGDVSIFIPGWREGDGLLRMAPIKSSEGGAVHGFVNIRGDRVADAELNVLRVQPAELHVTLGERQQVRDGLVRVPIAVEIPAGTRPMARAGEDQGGEGEIVLSTNQAGAAEIRMRVLFTVEP